MVGIAAIGLKAAARPARAMRMRPGVVEALICAAAVGGAAAFMGMLGDAKPQPERLLAGYATSLRERTPSQRHNARRAAEALNGRTILPGATFSFNAVVRSWSWDRGYVKAPVSYDGELVRAFGGGVCQTSTTLYNAALLAGLPIVERHSHVFAPHYVSPGRDAAVAQRNIDLRFTNPYSWPITLRAAADDDRLEVRILGAGRPDTTVAIGTRMLSRSTPSRLTCLTHLPGGRPGKAYVRNPGAEGYRVLAYRTFYRGSQELRTERLSDDTYQAMSRLVLINEDD